MRSYALRALVGVLTIVAVFVPCFTMAGEVSVSIPDDQPSTVEIGLGSVRPIKIVITKFDGQSLSLLALGGDGDSRELTLIARDGQVYLVLGTPADPDPVDPVDPVDPGDPDIPPGHLGFTESTYRWVMDTVDPAADPRRAEHAAEQAVNYVLVGAGLVAQPPTWETVAEAFKALRELNRRVLPDGPVRDAWAEFAQRANDEITKLWPFSNAEADRIMRAIADGLRAVE